MARQMTGGRPRLALALALVACSSSALWAEDAPQEGFVVALMSTSDRIDLLPGQAIIFVPEAGKMTFIRFVEGPMEPELGELKLEFASQNGQSRLTATSKIDIGYNYRAEVVKESGAKKGKPTSVCTIMAGGRAFESWPVAIPVLRVMDFKAATDGNIGCSKGK
jgi:hypothetical protein